MRFNYRIAFAVVVMATMLVAIVGVAQTGKRVVDLKAPVINDNEVKVECVHSYPHMVLRSKINEIATFSLASDAKVERTDCKRDGVGAFIVPPGQRCTVFFSGKDAGTYITQVSAETPKTSYAFRGNWPIYACCRGKFETKELDESKGPHSKESLSDIKMTGDNQSLKSGTVYRGYEITLYPDRVDSHNREKDSTNPFSVNINWKTRKLLKGACAADDR